MDDIGTMTSAVSARSWAWWSTPIIRLRTTVCFVSTHKISMLCRSGEEKRPPFEFWLDCDTEIRCPGARGFRGRDRPDQHVCRLPCGSVCEWWLRSAWLRSVDVVQLAVFVSGDTSRLVCALLEGIKACVAHSSVILPCQWATQHAS
jgi:hypothetical protein